MIYSTKPIATTIQTTSEFYSTRYKMDYANRGKAVIINNKKFNPNTGLNDRNGTDVDASALCCRLSELDFDVDLFHNLKADEIKQQLHKGEIPVTKMSKSNSSTKISRIKFQFMKRLKSNSWR